MNKNLIMVLPFLLLLVSCSDPIKKADARQPVEDTTLSSQIPENISMSDEHTDSCSYYVYAIVYTSDLKKKNQAYATVLKDTATPISYFVDHSDDTSVVIHVGFDNDAEPGEKIESTLAWINVDLQKNEVRDISIDPEHGILLKVDKNILQAMKKCNYKAP